MSFPALFAACGVADPGYPLDDDGSVAAAYSMRALAATGSAQTTVPITYDATLTQRLASRTLASLFTSAAKRIADGPWHAELCLDTPPSGSPANFGNIGILAVPSLAGVPDSGSNVKEIAISNQSGTNKVSVLGAPDQTITSSLSGFRISIDVSANGTVTYRSTDGLVGTLSGSLAAFDAVTFFVTVIPTAAANGSTAQASLKAKASDVTLTAVAGAKALDGRVI